MPVVSKRKEITQQRPSKLQTNEYSSENRDVETFKGTKRGTQTPQQSMSYRTRTTPNLMFQVRRVQGADFASSLYEETS